MNIISNDNIQATIALAALQEVIDPEIGLNIVDLGLVYQLDFQENEKKIYLTMTLTTQFCPMGESITNGAEHVLQGAFPGSQIEVNLVFDPPWNTTLISEEGQQFLNS